MQAMLNCRQIQWLPYDKDLVFCCLFVLSQHLNKPQVKTDEMQGHEVHSSLGMILQKKNLCGKERGRMRVSV